MEDVLVLVIALLFVIIGSYPFFLSIRFMRLGCKAFKLYIRNAKHEQYSLDASDYECDSLDDDSSLC